MQEQFKTGDEIVYVDENGAETPGKILGPGKPEKHSSVVKPFNAHEGYPGPKEPTELWWEIKLVTSTTITVRESSLRKPA